MLHVMGAEHAEQLFDALRAEYVAELPESLAALERQTVDWRAGHPVSTKFLRDVHSLKGTAGTYGLSFVTSACHHLEDLLSKHEPGGDHRGHVDTVLGYIDLIREYVTAVRAGGDPVGAEFTPRLDALLHGGAIRRRRILIVEPARNMSRLYRRLLDSHGVKTSTSRGGYEALGRLTRENYDAVLTSYETSDVSGPSLAKAIQALDEISDEVKVILVTSNDLAEQLPGVDRVVRKDRELQEALTQTLEDEGLLD